MTDQKSPLDQAVELLVYAPVGLVITARDSLPSLIEKGRQRVSSQLAMAKMMGQYAVSEGEKQLRDRLEEVAQTVTQLADQAQAPAAAPSADAAPTTPPPGAEAAPATNGKATTGPSGATTTGDHLAITGYDTLSASQVVQRLAGLSPEELEAVRGYEESTRGRRTILSKISQLQAEPKS